MNIAERIKIIRAKESRESFAQKIGVHAQTLYRYEQGGRDVDSGVIISLCKEFNISASWLLFGEGSMHPGEPAQPTETARQQPVNALETDSCARCAKMETELELERQERREMNAELREVNAENRRLAKENGELRTEVAVLQERLKVLSGKSVAVDVA